MLKKTYHLKINLLCIICACICACTGDFEDTNTNPDKPISVPATNVLAYALEGFAFNNYSVQYCVNGGEFGFAHHIGKIQYPEESIYQYRGGEVNDFWKLCYEYLVNLQDVEEIARKEGSTNMEAAAMTFSSLIWHTMTDRWRDIPFSDALKADKGVYSPVYMTQEEIYPAIIDSLKKANDLFNQGGTDELGDGDFLFDGAIRLWQKFNNSLLLRIAIRLSNVEPETSKNLIETIIANPSSYPIMESNDDNAFFNWIGTDPYEEPLYYNKEVDSRDDHGVAKALIDTLTNLNDPRRPFYAHPAQSDGVYRGVTVGLNGGITINSISRTGTRFRDEPTGFSPIMDYPEVMFILAEAAQRGWHVGITAKDAYEAAITASMKENVSSAEGHISDAEIATYLKKANVAFNNTLERIYLQKWIALFKNAEEAWSEIRRTDVPAFGPAPEGVMEQDHNRGPFREPYPASETNLNKSNSATYVNKVEDSYWGQQMYWDTRTGVY